MPVSSPNAPSILPSAQTSGGSLKEKANNFRYNTSGRKDADLWSSVGEAFSNAQSQIDNITNALRKPVPQPQIYQVTDQNGNLVAEIGNFLGGNNQSYPGIWGKNLYIGGSGPDTAPLFANGAGSGGQIYVVDSFGNIGSWLGYQNEAPKNVTGAVDNGSGNVRLTVTAHGYVNGDNTLVQNVGGVPGANQSMGIVSVVDADHFDLVGSVFSGAYTSGGTSTRFFSGGLFAAVAIGGSQIITNIANNGSGAVRITIPGHGFSTGYAVTITDTSGIPNLNYISWIITVIDANNFDLVGSVFSGSYNGAGGQCLNWPTAKLIAYDTGELVITNAEIVLNGSAAKITLDPTVGQITVVSVSGPPYDETQITATGIELFQTGIGATTYLINLTTDGIDLTSTAGGHAYEVNITPDGNIYIKATSGGGLQVQQTTPSTGNISNVTPTSINITDGTHTSQMLPTGFTQNGHTGFTGTLAAAIGGGYNVYGGMIAP